MSAFEELERDPLGELETVYQSIGLNDYAAARPCIETYLHSIRGYEKSSYTFSREDVARVTERWQPFVTRFGYRPPRLEHLAV
jgi:omega-hydroxy-beta-dihydromenaquinone-9 sulfotransferase